MASSAPVISSNDLKSFRLSLFVRKYGKKVVHLIYTFHFLHGQHKSIEEILTDNQVPMQGRCPFNDQDIRNLTEKPPKDLDITLMNKICQVLWQKGVNDPGNELKVLLRKIKDERNFVSHEEPHMSEQELQSKLRDFRATLKETLEKIKSLFPSHGSDTDQLKTEIQNAVPKLLEKIREKYDPSNPQDVQRLKEEIGEFESEFYEMIQESSEAELRPLNERLGQILPYDWLAQYGTTDPGKIMVPLQVANDQDLNKGPHGNKSIVNEKEILNKDKIGSDPEVFILSGDAGSGKTTILSSYAEGWCKKTMDMPELSSFPFLLCMQFRNHDHDNFEDYLKSMIPKTAARFPFDLVKSVVLNSKCLVLCDGYDEANDNSEKLFQEFLKLNSNKMKFVVTTRPGNTMKLTKIVNKAQRSRINLSVSGLREEDMKSLSEKLIGHLVRNDVPQQEQMKRELLQKIKDMNTDTRDILQTPLYFNLFVLLYIECQDLRDEMNTRASVYLQLRKHKIKRISDRTGISEESLEEFDALCKKRCLKHYTEKKYEWGETDVRSFKEEIRQALPEKAFENFDAIMSSYFSIKKTKKHLDIVNVYCHRHRSEQEFAAAGSICDDIVTLRERTQGGNILRDILLSIGFWDGIDPRQIFVSFREVISFIPGILYGTERDVLYDTIDEIHELYVSSSTSGFNHDDLLNPCIETRLDNKVLESLVSQMKKKTYLEDRVKFRKPKSLYVLPSLLPKLRPKNVALDFPYSNVRRNASLSETLKSALHNNIRTEVELGMRLSECEQLPGQEEEEEEEEEILPPVDKLRVSICYDGYEDLESLRRPFSLATPPKELLTLGYVILLVARDGGSNIAEVINRTFPTTRDEGGGGGGKGRGCTDLDIDLSNSPAPDIKLLLQSLTPPPPPSSLRGIWIDLPFGTNIDDDDVEEWKPLCKNKGVKCLIVSNVKHDVLVHVESEEGEQQQQEAEGRQEEEGEKEEEEQQQEAEGRKGEKREAGEEEQQQEAEERKEEEGEKEEEQQQQEAEEEKRKREGEETDDKREKRESGRRKKPSI